MYRLFATHGDFAAGEPVATIQALIFKDGKGFSFSETFKRALSEFMAIAIQFAHGRAPSLSEGNAQAVARSGLRLLQTVLDVRLAILMIARTTITVFRNADCSKRLEGVEGLILFRAAYVYDDSGFNFPAVTDRLGYYERGDRVSPEWGPTLGNGPLWIKNENSDPDAGVAPIDKVDEPRYFRGRPLDDLGLL